MNAPRTLGLGAAVALVVTATVGTGVFTTSGLLLADLGSPYLVLAAWVVGAVITLLGALSYGALVRKLPESGGEYLFLSRSIHPAAGYVAGWISALVGFAAPLAAGALAFVEYAGSGPFAPRVSATVLLLAAAALHAIALGASGWFQAVAVGIEIVIIALFVCFGAAEVNAPPVTAVAVSPAVFGSGLVWVLYAYTGWNNVAYVAGDVRDPARTVPRAMVIGTLIVAALYLSLNAVVLFSAPASALAGRLDVARVAAEAIGGPRLAAALSAMVAVVLICFVSATTMAGPHVMARMADDGYLPAFLRGRRGDAPRMAMLVQLIIALLLVWTAAYENLLTYAGLTLSLSTAATVAGLMRLRLREGAALPVIGWPWVPALFLASVLAVAAFTSVRRPMEALISLATIGAALAAYALGRRRC